VPFYANKLVNCITKIHEQINKIKFAKNNKALNAKDKAKNFCGKIQKGALIGSGGLGAVYELNNDKDYVIKVPHAKNYDELLNANEDAEEEFSKAEKLRRIINDYIDNYNFAGAQALENAAAPVHIAHEQVDYGKINELIMPKAEGEDGDKLIFGNSKNDKSPISIYINELGYGDFTITSRRKALSIALQKAMILRALNNGGYANIDTKLKNIMISEDGKVSMIDIGSIVKHGDEIRAYTRYTAAPEVDFGKNANPKSDVFSDAIDRPYILFGSIAEKYIPRFFKKRYGYDEKNIYMKDIVKTYENASYFDVQSKKSEYHRAGFQEPTFPEYFTNSQKMRYMHYHLGFLKVQREVGEIYPIKVLDTFAKLQAFSTEPNPEIRIDEEIVERVLLHLMMSIDHWRNGVYRIEGIETVPGSMTDEILPKNNEQPQLKRATSTERLKRNIAFPGNNENLLRDRSKNERVYYVIPNKLVAKFAN
jgi:serine/threonine protein kinase